MEFFDPAELDCFRNIVGSRLGLQFENGKNDLLADVLRQRLRVHGCTGLTQYLQSAALTHEELRVLTTHLTVSETYFFRGAEQFHALLETAMPERSRVRAANRRLRILSAGCASGEEAYSIAMLLRERFPELGKEDVEILGWDLNPAMIAKAANGRYPAWSLRETPPDLRNNYFRKAGLDFLLSDDIRSMVSFEERNLVTADATKLGQFDIIFCRNVIMYLVPGAAQFAIRKLTEALLPQGFLFLGYAETLRGLSRDFHLRHTHNTFYYQKAEGSEPPPECIETDAQATTVPTPRWSDTVWVDAVQQVSERIHSLSRTSREVIDPSKADLAQATSTQTNACSRLALNFALDLFRQEKFQEALEVVQGLPPESSGDRDAQLLRAGLLTNCGDLEAAENVCRQILRADDLNAGAHYLTALCRERAGDFHSAMEHDRAATYLDSAFAMPHLHLGRLAQRLGDLVTARRELEYAGLLLLQEDPLRLLLFGGGFNREALVAFSRAELRGCGGSA